MGNLCDAKFLRISRILANCKIFFRELYNVGVARRARGNSQIFFSQNLRELSFRKKLATRKFPDIRYHAYKDIWEATIGQNLPCRKELNNRHNPFAFAAPGYQIIVGVIARGQNSTG